jgi:hemoglobin
MKQLKDIANDADIKLLVDTFYDKLLHDEIMKPIFAHVVNEGLEIHLERIYDFWNSILLYTRKYKGDMNGKHIPLNISEKHFTIWLTYFNETVDEYFEGEIASEAKNRALTMARVMKAMKGIPL